MKALSPAMKRQLVTLYRHQTGTLSQRPQINLTLVKALVTRGLASERYGNDLRTGTRMPSAYPLTAAGRIEAMTAFTELHGNGGASTH